MRSLPQLDLRLWLETQALLQATAGHLHTREAYRDHCLKNEALCIPALLPLLDICSLRLLLSSMLYPSFTYYVYCFSLTRI